MKIVSSKTLPRAEQKKIFSCRLSEQSATFCSRASLPALIFALQSLQLFCGAQKITRKKMVDNGSVDKLAKRGTGEANEDSPAQAPINPKLRMKPGKRRKTLVSTDLWAPRGAESSITCRNGRPGSLVKLWVLPIMFGCVNTHTHTHSVGSLR